MLADSMHMLASTNSHSPDTQSSSTVEDCGPSGWFPMKENGEVTEVEFNQFGECVAVPNSDEATLREVFVPKYDDKWVLLEDGTNVSAVGVTAGLDEQSQNRCYIAQVKNGRDWVPCDLFAENGKFAFHDSKTGRKLEAKSCRYLRKPGCCELTWEKVPVGIAPSNAVVGVHTCQNKPVHIARIKPGRICDFNQVQLTDVCDDSKTCEVLVHTHPSKITS